MPRSDVRIGFLSNVDARQLAHFTAWPSQLIAFLQDQGRKLVLPTIACLVITLTIVGTVSKPAHLSAQTGPSILVYLPIHYTSLPTLDGFLSCMSHKLAVRDVAAFGARVDLLILTNGDRDLDDGERIKAQGSLASLKLLVPQFDKAKAVLFLGWLERRLEIPLGSSRAFSGDGPMFRANAPSPMSAGRFGRCPRQQFCLLSSLSTISTPRHHRHVKTKSTGLACAHHAAA